MFLLHVYMHPIYCLCTLIIVIGVAVAVAVAGVLCTIIIILTAFIVYVHRHKCYKSRHKGMNIIAILVKV